LIGDDDGGRLVELSESAGNDFRSTLSNGAALFGRADYKYVCGGVSEETLWLSGPEAVEDSDTISSSMPANTSRGFSDGGYYIMRDSWTDSANYLAIDCGPLGVLNCGHAHADALAIDLSAMGRTVVADPGTYTYTASAEERNWFRSSAAHSTVLVDDSGSSEPGDGPFNWRSTASATTLRWITNERVDFFEGSQDGFARLSSPVEHSRLVLFIRGEYWLIRDRLNSATPHKYSVQFHFASGIEPRIECSKQPVVLSADRGGRSLQIAGLGGDWSLQPHFTSSCYGSKTESHIATLVAVALRHDFLSVALPVCTADLEGFCVSAMDGFTEIRQNGYVDHFYEGDGTLVNNGRLTSDFRMVWFRLSKDGDTVSEIVAVDGTRLEFEGNSFLQGGQHIELLTAKRCGSRFRVTTRNGTVTEITRELEFIESTVGAKVF
jgi:hypothetical protein